MRLTIYPRNQILRLAFLVGYFLLSIQAFYWLRPYFLEYAESIMMKGADYESFTDSFMGITWAGFWVFISFGFILEILQRKGKGRMDSEIGRFEFWLLRACIAVTGLGMLKLGGAMFDNESFFALLKESFEAIVLISSGIGMISLVSIFRPVFYKRKKHNKSAHTTSAIAPR